MNDIALSLVPILRKLSASDKNRVFLGFDAFIDLVVRPIEKGNSNNVGKYYKEMASFGQYLINKSGMSSSVELDLIRRKLGGNTPNVAIALGHLGVEIDCLAPFGTQVIDEAFAVLEKFGNLISIGDPGLSIALEFLDGKLMLALNQDVNKIDWQRIKDRTGIKNLIDRVGKADMLCLLNWSEVPRATDIFNGFKEEILAQIEPGKPILIDLSDCSRRNNNDLLEILEIISSLAESGKVILGLNENESQIVCDVLGIDDSKTDIYKAGKVRDRLNLHWVVFHNRLRSILATEIKTYSYMTKINSQPVLQTGAGDHFNAGLCRGYLDGLAPELCLALASATSGYYVEKGKSANIEDLTNYILEMEEN